MKLGIRWALAAAIAGCAAAGCALDPGVTWRTDPYGEDCEDPEELACFQDGDDDSLGVDGEYGDRGDDGRIHEPPAGEEPPDAAIRRRAPGAQAPAPGLLRRAGSDGPGRGR
jgi:hypothetical protein